MKAKCHIIIILFIYVLCNSTSAAYAFQQDISKEEVLRLVRIECSDVAKMENDLNNQYYDVIGSMEPNSIDVVVSVGEIDDLKEKNIRFSIIRKGKPLNDNFQNIPSTGELPARYPSLEEINARMQTIAHDYPEIVKLYDLTDEYNMSATSEGRHLYAIKISDNVGVEEDEHDIMIVSNHHAREVITPLIAFNAIDQLTGKYGYDDRITELVNNNEIWVAPNWNPDGYNHCYTTDAMWRKNRRIFDTGIGVDQNRNYPHLWDGAHSGSTNPSSQIHKGPAPASEPETQTMIAFANDQVFEKLLDFHSSGRQVLWGFYNPSHPFDAWFHDEAELLADTCGYTSANHTRKPTADGENYHWHLAYTGSNAFLVETHTQFIPEYASAIAEANQLWPGIMWFMERDIPLSGHIKDLDTGDPIVANFEIAGINYITEEINISTEPYGAYHLFIPPGEYDITFSAEGYNDKEVHVIVADGEANIVEVEMTKTGTFIDDYVINGRGSGNKIISINNYPNPFNTQTDISYSLAERGKISIEVFNNSGQKINTLLDDDQSEGDYKIGWDGTDFSGNSISSGIYFCEIKITTGNSYYSSHCKLLKY